LRTHELFRVIIVYVATYGLMTSLDVRYLPQLTSVFAMSAFGGKADMALSLKFAIAVAVGGKADMTCCAAYVCF